MTPRCTPPQTQTNFWANEMLTVEKSERAANKQTDKIDK